MRTRFPTCRLLLGLGLASCAIGAPPGFSPGTSWTTPLVDPLADGRLVTPVYVNGEGPFLFAIDPDATITTADMSLAAIARSRPTAASASPTSTTPRTRSGTRSCRTSRSARSTSA